MKDAEPESTREATELMIIKNYINYAKSDH